MKQKLFVKQIKSLLMEDAGWKLKPLISGIRLLVSIDDGDQKHIESATIGVRCTIQLKMCPELEKEKYPGQPAAEIVRKEIEKFLKLRYSKVFASNLYKIEGFSAKNPDTGHTFPAGHDYASSSMFKMNGKYITDIYDSVTFKSPVDEETLFKDLKDNVTSKIANDPLFNPDSSDCWKIV